MVSKASTAKTCQSPLPAPTRLEVSSSSKPTPAIATIPQSLPLTASHSIVMEVMPTHRLNTSPSASTSSRSKTSTSLVATSKAIPLVPVPLSPTTGLGSSTLVVAQATPSCATSTVAPSTFYPPASTT